MSPRKYIHVQLFVLLALSGCLILELGSCQMDYEGSKRVSASSHASVPICVVDTCNDDWQSADGAADTNMDVAPCSSVRHMVSMSQLKANISGHWCKAWLAVNRYNDRRYRYMLFRDDDTILDVHRLISLMLKTGAPIIASYKLRTKHVVTNWFIFDTYSMNVCDNMRAWWNLARRDHPEHDQKYFNQIFECGKDGLLCLDKFHNDLNEIHCRSSLGPYRSLKRQECMRYRVHPNPSLL